MSVSWSVLSKHDDVVDADWLPGYAMMWKTVPARRVAFNERFDGYANGEDLEFGLRMVSYGKLRIAGAAHLRHEHEPGGRPAAFALGWTTVRNAFDIHRRCLPARRTLDVIWFFYAFAMDTVLQGAACFRPPGPRWRCPYIGGRLASLVVLLLRHAVSAMHAEREQRRPSTPFPID
jgi:hypothetical protein